MGKAVIPWVVLVGLTACKNERAEEERLSSAPVERITLQRTACLGSCPIYTVTFYQDGRAELLAEAHLSKRGNFEGRIGGKVFTELCDGISRNQFDALKPRYDAAYTDAPSCTVTVLRTDGKGKSVYEYSREGPGGLHAIQQAIDDARDRVDWQPVK